MGSSSRPWRSVRAALLVAAVAAGLSAAGQTAAGAVAAPAPTAAGTAFGWGSNNWGQVGDSVVGPPRSTPVPVTSGAGGLPGQVRQVAVGGTFSIGLLPDGRVYGWGEDDFGALGDGPAVRPNTAVPAPVTGLTGVTQVAAGLYHVLAVRSDGTVWGWGDNGGHQINGGTATSYPAPVQVLGLSGIVQVAGGSDFSLARRSDGAVFAWGGNSQHQLGDGTTVSRLAPVQVPGLTGVVQVDAGFRTGLALRSTGTVVGWGANESGEIGDGSTVERATPVPVPGLTGVKSISTSMGHTLAVAGADSSVWAWGYNVNGALGNGTTVDAHAPVHLSLAGVTQVAAGWYGSTAVQSSGAVFTWGTNGDGMLGIGDFSVGFATTPTRVTALTGRRAVGVASGGFTDFAIVAPAATS